MDRFAGWSAASVVAAASLMSPSAHAVVVGNVGAFSEYLFRGVIGEGGAAVQGGIDWYADSGIFLGTWASNSSVAGGTELDLYGGYGFKINDQSSLDVGALYYVFPEDEEKHHVDLDGDGKSDDTDFDFLELLAGYTYRWLKLQVYYADQYANQHDDGLYLNAILTVPIQETLNVAFQVGNTSGDGPKAYFGDDYTDYSVTLNKTIREGLTFSLGVVDTDLHDTNVLFIDASDKPKVVVSAKQVFNF